MGKLTALLKPLVLPWVLELVLALAATAQPLATTNATPSDYGVVVVAWSCGSSCRPLPR